jgi:CheY-like chemotaxis protein
VDSEIDKGTTFTVELPLQEVKEQKEEVGVAELAEEETGTAPQMDGEMEGEPQRTRVLVAEDNEMNRKLMERLLKILGVRYSFTNNGKSALDMLISSADQEDDSFDIVLLDIQMPVMDGKETLKEIRKEEKLKNTWVVALTAYAMEGDREKYLHMGFNDYISKPIDLPQFFSMIQGIMK